MLFFLRTLPFFVSAVSGSHSIRFFNYCGSGTPTIVTRGSRTSLDVGITFYSNNDDGGVIHSFLEQGTCGNNGTECTTVDVDLTIPEASISKTSEFSVPLSLQYSCANNSIYFAQCYSSNCTPTPISCNSFDSQLIITFCPLGSPSITKSDDSSSSSTLVRKLIAPIIIIIVLIIALTFTILFLRRKNRRVPTDTETETIPRVSVSRENSPPIPRRPERASILTVPSHQSTRVASTITKESWQDFQSGSYFVKLYPTESGMSAFED
ncbi:hypothetical protein EDD18DRAFT_671097 [Armillaria luteobubalina]|uniref:Mid2 domain-containing protein n=1 Tax=Armillaria luteobubalina TaxID=153913 RepID=A0AA39PLZ6_9AGAR|nr:hypothetical protein EDD18DRAFT_671097 [Armillaria luteobubalina]